MKIFGNHRWFVFVLAVAMLAATAWTKGAVPDPGQKGPYEIGQTFFCITDTGRDIGAGGRPIAVYIWYPVDPGSITASSPEAVYPLDPFALGTWGDTTSSDWEPYGFDRTYHEPPPYPGRTFPLVMFSPGWGCPAWFNNYLAARLASHGFVVAALYHYGDGCFVWEPWDHIATASLNRPLDVSFALTELLRRNAAAGNLLYGSIDPDKIAASGHSLGGYASMVLGGAQDECVCDFFRDDPSMVEWLGPPPAETCVPAVPDPRIKAIVPLDGSNQVLKFSELTRLRIPVMGMGEEWDVLALDPSFTSWQARQHAAFMGKPSYRVDVAGTYHMTFTNIWEAAYVLHDKGLIDDEEFELWLFYYGTAGIESIEAQRLIAKYAVAFLKTNLAGEPGYQHILTPGYALTREQYIEFFVTEKKNPHAIEADWPDLFIYFPHQSGSVQARADKNPKNAPMVTHPRIRR